MASKEPLCPILYQNAEGDVTLIDVGISIAAAQGTRSHPVFSKLLASKPPTEPYATNNPKSIDAEKKLAANTVDAGLHKEYSTVIWQALSHIRHHVQGDWCFARDNKPEDTQPWCADTVQQTLLRLEGVSQSLLPQLAKQCSSQHVPVRGQQRFLVKYSRFSQEDADGTNVEEKDKTESYSPYDPLQHNPDEVTVKLEILDASIAQKAPYIFRIPPKATFLLGDCADATSLRTAVRTMSADYGTPRKFDLIVCDPPWPNASSKRKGAYSTQPLRNIKQLLLRMDLDTYIAPNGLVGFWITNKPAIRTWVLGSGGLFEKLNVGLVEEWIWIKTTVKGEPIFSLDQLWRKPYEVLLLGRAPASSLSMAEPAAEVKRRVIVGVPDFHSRKPCLKQLLEQLMPNPERYSALEIFARHLVAGWWSYGNEVIKFNWEGYWAD